MGDVIQDVLIINFDGKTLASRMVNLSEMKEYIGLLISALTSFIKEVNEEELSCFEFNTLRFNLVKREHVIFVGTSDKKDKQKKVLKELNIIANRFFRKYSPDKLKSLNGDLQEFVSFEQEVLNTNRKEQLLDFISNHWASN